MKAKIGDIFRVSIGGGACKFFQYVGKDQYQLGSDVIIVFRESRECSQILNIEAIASGAVEFYVHCSILLGSKLRLWDKVGNQIIVAKIDNLRFRDTVDYGVKLGEEPIKYSKKWYVWSLGDIDPTFAGDLKNEKEIPEIGVLVNPESVVHRIRSGVYDFIYPEVEL